MPKTITVRVDDGVYELLKKAADGERRTISNFIEYAALSYLTGDIHVSDAEMNEILRDADIVSGINKGLKDVQKGKYHIVD